MQGYNVIAVYNEVEIIGLISIKDKVKENGKELISLLKEKGITPIMVTGDKKEIALSIRNDWLETYRKRPAMIDELKKVKL